jgi:argininosuccinate lyase
MFRNMMASAVFNTDRMAAACIGGFLEATDAAEYLVRKGLPFRNAHETSARLVRAAIAAGYDSIARMSLDELKLGSPLFETDVYALLEPAACAAARRLTGGTAPEEVRRQIARLRCAVS